MSSIKIIIILLAPVFFSCSRKDKIFTDLSSSKTNIDFANFPLERKGLNILYHLYYYNGGGVATGDVNNDGLADIYFTANNKAKNKLYINKGDLEFEDVTDKAGVAGSSEWCSGVTMADVNADGYLDIYVSAVARSSNLQGHNELFINNKNGTFSEKSGEYGLDFAGQSTQAAFFDYDRDGDLDCFLLNYSKRPHANIVDTINRRTYDTLSGDRLYRNELNNGSLKFVDVSAQAGIYQSSLGYGLGLAVGDLNNDGWDDIYIGNDFHENDYYYVNNGNGTFSEKGADHFRHYSRFSMGNDIADYNNDGQLDIVTVDMLPPDEKILKTYGSDENPDIYNLKLTQHGYQHQSSKNALQRNNGNGSSFSETSLISGMSATDWSWCALFADFDNDSNKDLLITSGIVKRPVDLDYVRFVSDLQMKKGMDKTDIYDDMAIEKMPDGSSHPFFFKGDGHLTFTDVSKEWGTSGLKGYFTGAAYADLDNDGDMDIVLNRINAKANILENTNRVRNHLSLSFKNDDKNTFGIGAKAYLFAGGKMQYQQLMLTRGFQSSSEPKLHFGLDSVTTIDSLLIVWPDQRYQLLKNIPANKDLTASRSDASGSFRLDEWIHVTDTVLKLQEQPQSWKHIENNFVDYNIQYLIPHAQSTRGPKLAVADINNDGLDDVYACGAIGQPGALLIQQSTGLFRQANVGVFNLDSRCEDVDAIFFDVNKDGNIDLYVVSGGNQYSGDDPMLLDRLYINDGNGHFRKDSLALPAIYRNKSTVSVSDIDKDGDDDIFCGVLADPVAFGIPQTSYLLLNDGKGKFTLAGNDIIDLRDLGIVTSSQMYDINKDNFPDLIVAGEWMPVTLFINNKGRFTKKAITGSTGLWQTIKVEDVNNDGNADLLCGNWGYNNKFWSGKNGPARLYVADFDKNGKTEQLLSYTLNGIEYPFLAKDEVERPLPLLKKHYLLYAEYAGVPMKEVFYGWVDTVKPYLCERLGSAVFYGDGKGDFTITDLPKELQLAPIFSFQSLNTTSGKLYIAGGNFFDVIPYEGRYDAQPLALFTASGNELRYIHQPNLFDVVGQVRDVKQVKGPDGNKFVIARNNENLLIYSSKKL